MEVVRFSIPRHRFSENNVLYDVLAEAFAIDKDWISSHVGECIQLAGAGLRWGDEMRYRINALPIPFVCRLDQFARFLILRDAKKITNWFHELEPKIGNTIIVPVLDVSARGD